MDAQKPLATPRRAGRRTNPRHATLSLVGAGVGLLSFLVTALLPALLHGGIAGVQLANGIFDVPSAHPFGVDAFAVFGILVSVTTVACLFAALGAVAGASVGALASLSAGEKG